MCTSYIRLQLSIVSVSILMVLNAKYLKCKYYQSYFEYLSSFQLPENESVSSIAKIRNPFFMNMALSLLNWLV